LSITLGEEEAFKTVALNLLRKHGREFLRLPDESRILAAQAAEREQKMVEEAKAAAERKQKMVEEAEAAAAAATLPSPIPPPSPELELKQLMAAQMPTKQKAQRYFTDVNFTSLDGTKTETAILLFSNLKKIDKLTDEKAFETIALILMKKLGPNFFKSRDNNGNKTVVEIKTDEVPYEFNNIPY